ncbi:MAG: tyrosine-type recombinase/integrase [Actinomycetota bacterium]
MRPTPKKLDALMLGFTAYMADRRERPLARESRYGYRTRVARAIQIANEAGHSLLADDVRTLRYVLGRLSPHPSTQAGYIAALETFYEFLVAQGLRKTNPAKEIGRPRHLKHAPRPLDRDACARYETAAAELGPMYEAVGILGLYQGWRRSEMRFARWSWFFQAEGATWCDVTGKGSRTARVPVHSRTLAALDRLRASHSDPIWLFTSPLKRGEPVGGTWFSNAHHRICEQAGLPTTLRLHQLRHSYATWLRGAGADMAIVQMGLRHVSPTSTAVYMRVFPSELLAAQERMRFSGPDSSH